MRVSVKIIHLNYIIAIEFTWLRLRIYPKIKGEAVLGCGAAKPHHTSKQQSANFRIGSKFFP